MKTKIFFTMIAFLLISIGALNVLLNQQEKVSLSTLALANLNALADAENGENPGGGENSGTGDFNYDIDKDNCRIKISTEAQASVILKLFGVQGSVGGYVDLSDFTALYTPGKKYRLGSDKTCAMLGTEIINAASK